MFKFFTQLHSNIKLAWMMRDYDVEETRNGKTILVRRK